MAERSRSSKRCAVAVNPQFRGSRIDRISSLSNDLLGHILSFVPALEAVRSSALSRRWRRAWTHTPDLKISDELHQERFLDFARALLAQYGEAPDIPSLNVAIGCQSNLGPATAAWLRDAMPSVVGSICVEMDRYSLEQLVLPSSLQAKAMALNLSANFYHKPLLIFPEHPEPAAFSRLAELSLSNVKLQMHGCGEFLSSCFPQLRKLHLRSVYNMGKQGLWPLILHMDMLEELKVDDVYQLTLLQVVAAKLRLLTVVHCFRSLAALTTDTLVNISAPRLEVISWSGRFPKQLNFLTDVRCVRRLSGLLVYWPSISRIDFSLPDVVKFLETCSGADWLDVCVDIPDGLIPSMLAREVDDDKTEAAKPSQGQEFDPWKPPKDQMQLGSLREIRISGFLGTDPEMELANLLFGVGAARPALERISITSFAQLSDRMDRITLEMKARFPPTGGRWETSQWGEITWTKNNDGF
ncbi:putative F-box/FBD/LRR-repeat protein At4g03220 [Lolium perenne]|uniref:putative F-box/FBD/LRR-repeat protein At4g03220 n=1 Tax=Lolium perenne TaxID=4522 RepID=UPI003A9911DE